jgi:nucleoside-diphosphate-sugar epimerase
MSPKQAIILGYGFTGRAIDRAFNSRGYETFGVRRDWSDSGDENLHSEPLEADVTDPESLQDLPEDADVLVNCVSSGSRGDPDRYRKIYFEGSRNVLDWARSRNLELITWTGSSSVYGPRNGQWVDETSNLQPDSVAAEILVETEELYRKAHQEDDLPTVLFRVTGIYGPGRTRSFRKFRGGSVQLTLEEANYYMNMIHRKDIGRALVEAADDPQPGETFNLVDNKPVTRRKFYVWLSQKFDRPLPKISGGTSTESSNKRVSNNKFLNHYDFEFDYPTFQEGYGEIIDQGNFTIASRED